MIQVQFLDNSISNEGEVVTPFDLDDAGAMRRVMRCQNMVSAAIQVDVVTGTGSAFVLDVIVSCDPKGKIFQVHPSTIQLTNTAKVTPVFSVAGYLWVGVKLNTVNGGNAKADIYIVTKDA